MSVYLRDDKVVLVDGQVSTSEDCCCEPTGACCVDSDCSIQTETDCTGMDGSYQGDDTTCDPNPCVECVPCGFLVEGVYYLTRTYTNSAVNNCPPAGNCGESCDPPGISNCPPWSGNLWYFLGVCPDGSGDVLKSETYNPDCSELIQTFEQFDLQKYCESSCFFGPDPCPAPQFCEDAPDCTVDFCCPPSCLAGSSSCTTITIDPDPIYSNPNPCQ